MYPFSFVIFVSFHNSTQKCRRRELSPTLTRWRTRASLIGEFYSWFLNREHSTFNPQYRTDGFASDLGGSALNVWRIHLTGSQPCELIHSAASFGHSAVWPNFGSSPDPCV